MFLRALSHERLYRECWMASWVLSSRKLRRTFRCRVHTAFPCQGKVAGLASQSGWNEGSISETPTMQSRHTLQLIRPDPGRKHVESSPLRVPASGAAMGACWRWFSWKAHYIVVKKQGPCTEVYIKHIPKNIYAKVDKIHVISVDWLSVLCLS